MPDPNAKLTKMQILFHTTTNDKDVNTRLEVWINKAGEHEAAYADIAGEFQNDTTNGPFDVMPKTNPMIRSEINGSWVQIRITPSGGILGGPHDTWSFRFSVQLFFDDQTTFQQSFDAGYTLNEDGRTGIYPLQAA